jgi:hypothetical protein
MLGYDLLLRHKLLLVHDFLIYDLPLVRDLLLVHDDRDRVLCWLFHITGGHILKVDSQLARKACTIRNVLAFERPTKSFTYPPGL